MSKRCCCRDRRDYGVAGAYAGNSCGGNGLLILILIALQFKCRKGRHDDDDCGTGCIDNSILFLITLYYLCCHSNRFSLGCGNLGSPCCGF